VVKVLKSYTQVKVYILNKKITPVKVESHPFKHHLSKSTKVLIVNIHK